jgi:transposase
VLPTEQKSFQSGTFYIVHRYSIWQHRTGTRNAADCHVYCLRLRSRLCLCRITFAASLYLSVRTIKSKIHFLQKLPENMSNAKRVVHAQGREIIYSVYKFMKIEKERGAVTIPLNRLHERVAKATGVGVRTVHRIINEGAAKGDDSNVKSPQKEVDKATPKSSLNECEEKIIRKIIHNFTASQKRTPTVEAVLEAAKREGVNFTGNIASFKKLIEKLGFPGKKTENNRQVGIDRKTGN